MRNSIERTTQTTKPKWNRSMKDYTFTCGYLFLEHLKFQREWFFPFSKRCVIITFSIFLLFLLMFREIYILSRKKNQKTHTWTLSKTRARGKRRKQRFSFLPIAKPRKYISWARKDHHQPQSYFRWAMS